MVNNHHLFGAVLLMVMFMGKGICALEPKQVSSSYFFDHYMENTTHIDIFENGMAQIYVNNDTTPTYFLNTTEETDFEYKLGQTNYPYDVVHKPTPSNKGGLNEYFLFLIILFIMMLRNKESNHTGCIISEDNISVRLKDVAGLEDVKKEVFEFVDFLKNREKYLKCGARMPRGALLYGPPGCGKTMIAKAVAGECKVPFIAASGSDFCEMYVGVGAARIRNLFKKARSKAPCIVFIDEIDALARKRAYFAAGSSGSSEKDVTLNKLLIELDGFEPNDNILIFAATNRLDILDDALMRPGRFDRKIRFDLPERGDRERIFNNYLKKMTLEDEPDGLSEVLSKQSFGFSGADIANICNEACILSVRYNSENVTRKILETAVDNVLLGPEKKTFQLSDKEKRIVAYHESGHSVMSYMLKNVKPPIKVSIMPRGKSALGFSQSEMSEDKLKNKDELFEKMCVLLGGRVAEEIFCENITTGASDDIKKLTTLAYLYVSRYGMDESVGMFYFDGEHKDRYSETLKNKVDTAVQKIINRAYEKTKEMLEEHRQLIEKFAKKLLEKETINQIDIDIIFSHI